MTATATTLLLTAERLFGTQGIAATSLRQISQEAGQRNTSAAHYHYEDKKTLVAAVLNHRIGPIASRRRELLEALAPASDARAVVEVLVRPHAEQAATPGSFFARFLASLHVHLGRDVAAIQEIAALAGLLDAGLRLYALMPELSQQHGWQRGAWSGALIVNTTADFEALVQTPEGADLDAFIADLSDAVTGLMTAPITAPTRAARPNV
jgi:AcrR family transcriptional regulator